MHVLAWAAWSIAAVAVATATRNPYYLVIDLICIGILRWQFKRQETTQSYTVNTLKFVGFVLFFSAAYNVSVSHFGEHVLFTLPSKIPLIGGNFTLEALVYGLLNGLALSVIFAAFGLLNQVISMRDLISIVPRAFYPLALVVSIAVTFIPVTLRQYHQIKDAQEIRGHRIRGLRDWLGLLLPLLVGGLERAMQLAEAMTARGFAHTNGGYTNQMRTGLVVSLLSLLGGWLLWASGKEAFIGKVLFAFGFFAIVYILWHMGKHSLRTSYKNGVWSLRDTVTVAGALLAVVFIVLSFTGLGGSSLAYTPYPNLGWPGFSLWVGLSLLGLLAPIAAERMGSSPEEGIK